MTSVFISYSRKDSAIAKKLMSEFQSVELDVWVDWEDIPPAVGWLDQILQGIEQADAFIFLISPDSVKSEVCNVELEHAHKNAKRIIPIVVREVSPKDTVAIIRDLNWIFIRTPEEFQPSLEKVKIAINLDVNWLKEHRRLQVRALDWDRQKNPSLLLRGSDLRNAARMIAAHETSDPKPSELQKLYISSSQRSQRVNTVTIFSAALAMIIMAILSYLAFQGQQLAQENEKIARDNEKVAVENRQEADRNAAIARAQKVAAEKNALIAQSQRSAARAQIYQSRTGGLFTSTLLAIDSYQKLPTTEAEGILRKNISLLPIPLKEIQYGGEILAIAVSPDENTFVAASADGTACLTRFVDGESVYCTESSGPVLDAAFSPDGSFLVISDSLGEVHVLNADDGSLVKQINFGVSVRDVNISPDGKLLAMARDDARINIVKLTDFALYGEFSVFGNLRVTAFSPDGRWFAAASDQGAITFWNLGTKQIVNSGSHREEVFEIAFSPDSQTLISGSADNCAVLTSPFSGKQLLKVLNEDRVVNVAFSPDGEWFVTASDDFRIRVWDSKSGEERMRLLQESVVSEVVISPNGYWIASTGSDRTVRVWNAANGAEMFQIPIEAPGTKLQFSSDNKYLVTGDQDGHVSIWELSTLDANNGYLRFDEFIGNVELSPGGDWLAASTNGQVWLLDPNLYTTQTAPQGRPILDLRQETVYDLAIDPAGTLLALSTSEGRIITLNRTGGTQTLSNNSGNTTQVLFSPDGKNLFFATGNEEIQSRSLNSGEAGILWKGDSAITSMTASKDNLLAIGTSGRIVLFDLTSNTVIAELDSPGSNQFLRFDPSGNSLVSSSPSGQTIIWSNKNGQFERAFEITSGQVSSIAFNASGDRLFIGETDQILIFDPNTGTEVNRFRQKGEVIALASLPDSNILLTASLRALQYFDLSSIQNISGQEVINSACSRLTQNFSLAEWKFFFEDTEYKSLCAALPVP
jgi:WD40 repeat protein